jgi:hypothetical protein
MRWRLAQFAEGFDALTPKPVKPLNERHKAVPQQCHVLLRSEALALLWPAGANLHPVPARTVPPSPARGRGSPHAHEHEPEQRRGRDGHAEIRPAGWGNSASAMVGAIRHQFMVRGISTIAPRSPDWNRPRNAFARGWRTRPMWCRCAWTRDARQRAFLESVVVVVGTPSSSCRAGAIRAMIEQALAKKAKRCPP